MKIAFINYIIGLPVPSTMGGGTEELLTLLLDENEKSDGENQFYFLQKELFGKDKKYKTYKQYKNSKLVYVKYNRFLNFIERGISKILRMLGIKKDLPTFFPLEYHKKTLKEIKKINPDIIIFEGQIDALNKKYQKIFGKEKLILHMHFQDLQKIHIEKYVSKGIFVSNFIREDYENYLGEDSNKLRTYTLKNCVNQERFLKKISMQERENIRKKLGFDENDFVVAFCGRICEVKGIDKLIDAILKTSPRIKLLIMGSVSSAKKQKSAFLTKIEQVANSNSDKIKFTGYVKNSDLYKYYQSADLQVVPSMWEEAAGLVVIEGQICGIPQIITKSGGMVEYASDKTIILDRGDDFVKKLASEIEFLASNPDKLKEIKESGVENSKKYYKEEYYKNFIKIVNSMKQ